MPSSVQPIRRPRPPIGHKSIAHTGGLTIRPSSREFSPYLRLNILDSHCDAARRRRLSLRQLNQAGGQLIDCGLSCLHVLHEQWPMSEGYRSIATVALARLKGRLPFHAIMTSKLPIYVTSALKVKRCSHPSDQCRLIASSVLRKTINSDTYEENPTGNNMRPMLAYIMILAVAKDRFTSPTAKKAWKNFHLL